MKTNVVTKLIWFAACAAVLLSAENAVRADEPAQHKVEAKKLAQHTPASSHARE